MNLQAATIELHKLRSHIASKPPSEVAERILDAIQTVLGMGHAALVDCLNEFAREEGFAEVGIDDDLRPLLRSIIYRKRQQLMDCRHAIQRLRKLACRHCSEGYPLRPDGYHQVGSGGVLCEAAQAGGE